MCRCPLFPYLPQPSVTAGSSLPSISFEKILKLTLSRNEHFPSQTDSFFLASFDSTTSVATNNKAVNLLIVIQSLNHVLELTGLVFIRGILLLSLLQSTD